MARVLRRLTAAIFAWLLTAFGRLSWTPPAWARAALARLKASAAASALSRMVASARANPKRTRRVAGALALALVGAIGGYEGYRRWRERQPKPVYAEAEIVRPSPTTPGQPPDPLKFKFNMSVARLDALDKPVTGVTISPEIEGTWKWASDRTLAFQPGAKLPGSVDWRVGQHYDVRFARALFADGVELEDYKLGFETQPFKLRETETSFYVDPRDPKIKKVTATFSANYPIDAEALKKRTSFALRSKDAATLGQSAAAIAFSTTFNKDRTEAYLTSDALAVPREDSVMTVTIAKGATAAAGGPGTEDKIESAAEVPGLFGRLKIEGASVEFPRNDRYEPEQALVIRTTSEIKSEDVAAALKAWILPADKPAAGKLKKIKNYGWRSASEATPEVERASTPAPLELLPSPTEQSTTHAFRVHADPKRWLLLKIAKGLKGYGGYELAKDWNATVRVPDYPKELQIMSQGALLSLGGDKKLPFLARNLANVEIEIARVLPDRLGVLSTLAYRYGATFEKPNFSSIGVDDVAEKFVVKRAIKADKPGATDYFSVDLEPYLGRSSGGKHGLFYLTASEAHGVVFDSRMVLVSDLGVIAKETQNAAHEIFVQNVRAGKPVAGASVEVVGRNGVAVMTVSTDAEGRAKFPSLGDYKNEKEPVAFVVKKDGDLSFLPFRMESRRLEYSRFDVGGAYESGSADQLSAYVFSDRGVYRPGENVNLGMIVRSKNWAKSVKAAPLSWAVTDPRGNSVSREKFLADSAELKSFSFATGATAPTGVYSIEALAPRKGGGETSIGSATVRVEEFTPDKLRISTALAGERRDGWATPGDSMKANVSLRNLFGTPAENRLVRAQISLSSASPSFRAYKDFRFADLNSPRDRSFEESLGEKRTDKEGLASFDVDLSRYGAKVFLLRFDAEGFDQAGGRGVRASSATLVSTLPAMIGVKPDGDFAYVKKGAARSARVIAVNAEAKTIALDDVESILIERRYVSSLAQQPNGTYKYQSVLKEIPEKPKSMRIPQDGMNFVLPTDRPGDWAISFRKKGQDLELARFAFTVAGDANLTRSLERNAELQLALDKKDYQPGDEIEMQIKAPYAGAGLITIERDGVFASKWFKTASTSAIERIRIPPGIEGNAYVNVAFLRAIDSKEIFMSPLSYAVAPFSISLDARRTAIKLEAPDLVKPGRELRVAYSSDRPTQIVVFGADEGILQVARYQTPDPLGFFFKRRALQVKTFQLLDLLLPEFSVVQSLSAPGGDAAGALGKNLNPFKRKSQKPVAFWSGALKADATRRTYVYSVPDWFNGSIKIMAVAANASSLGATDRSILSRGDFVITPNAPEFAAPGDEFDLGVGVSNQLEGPNAGAALIVKVVAADSFEIVGPAEKTANVPQGREGETSFRVRAKAKLGSAKIDVRVAPAGKANASGAKASTEISVRPALPFETTIESGAIEKFPFEAPVKRRLAAEFRSQDFALSPLPLATGHALVRFLNEYPYGCTEQLISMAVPAVFLRAHAKFGIDAKKAADAYANAIAALRSRQTPDGAFALYAPGGGAHSAATLYAIQFLLDAREKGFAVPDDVLDRAVAYLKAGGVRSTDTLSAARLFAESLYLQARAGETPSNDVAFLRKALEKNFSKSWANDAAAAYLASAYKLMKQDDEADRLIARVDAAAPADDDYESFYGLAAKQSILVYLGARHFPERAKSLASASALARIAAQVGGGRYESHESGLALMALDAALKFSSATGDWRSSLNAEEVPATGAGRPLTLTGSGGLARATLSAQAARVRVSGSAPSTLFYAVTQSGFDADMPKVEVKSGLELQRAYFNKSGAEAKSAKLGEELNVRLRVRATARAQVQNVALVDLLPGGFDVVLESSAADGNGGEGGAARAAPDDDASGDGNGAGDAPDEGDAGDGARLRRELMPWRWLNAFAAPEAFAQSVSAALSPLRVDYADFREDRVVIYGVATKEAREFTYAIKATSSGQFTVPPPFGEAMYDRGVRFRGLPGSIKVEP